MGFIIDTIRKSALIIKKTTTEDSELQEIIPEPLFDGMVKCIKMETIDVVEDNNKKD